MPKTQGPQVVDRSSSRRLGAQVAWGTGLEALLALAILGSGSGLERYDRGEEMGRVQRRGLPPAVERALNLIRTPAGDPWSALIGLLATPDQANDLQTVIRRLEGMSPDDVKLAMMGGHRTSDAGPDDLLEVAERGGWAEEVRPVANLPAQELLSLVTQALRELPEEMYLVGSNAAGLLQRNAVDAQRLLAEADDAIAVIERVTNGVVYRSEPGIHGVMLVPSLLYRPWTLVLDHGDTKIFCYPARVESELSAPEGSLIAIYRALGDGTRLRILRRLAAGSTPVARISEELGLAKSTVHEHLLSLRSAGLVRISSSGGFELEPELPDLNWKLKEFLGLEMRRECEGCGKVLEADGVAFICSYECTFCEDCAQGNGHICPNCAGELVLRPKRSKAVRRPRTRTHSAGRAAVRPR